MNIKSQFSKFTSNVSYSPLWKLIEHIDINRIVRGQTIASGDEPVYVQKIFCTNYSYILSEIHKCLLFAGFNVGYVPKEFVITDSRVIKISFCKLDPVRRDEIILNGCYFTVNFSYLQLL